MDPKARAMLSKEGFRAAVEPLSARYRGAPQPFLSLLGKLLRFDPRQRMTCAEALADPLFADIRDVGAELRAAEPIRGDFDEEPLPPPSSAVLPGGVGHSTEADSGAAGLSPAGPAPGLGLGEATAGLVAAATSAALGFGWGKAADTTNSSSGGSGGSGNNDGSKSSNIDSGVDRPATERGLRQLIGLEVKAFDEERKH